MRIRNDDQMTPQSLEKDLNTLVVMIQSLFDLKQSFEPNYAEIYAHWHQLSDDTSRGPIDRILTSLRPRVEVFRADLERLRFALSHRFSYVSAKYSALESAPLPHKSLDIDGRVAHLEDEIAELKRANAELRKQLECAETS